MATKRVSEAFEEIETLRKDVKKLKRMCLSNSAALLISVAVLAYLLS